MKELELIWDKLSAQFEKEKKLIFEEKEKLKIEWIKLEEEKKKMKQIFDNERKLIEEEKSNMLKKVNLKKES